MTHIGRAKSLFVCNGRTQEKVIEAALKDAKCKAGDIAYFEAHGVGSSFNDVVEADSAISCLCGENDRPADRPLVFGSSKASIGYSEGAANLPSLIKTIFVLQTKIAPPLHHLKELNPRINLRSGRFVFPKEEPLPMEPFVVHEAPFLASVNAMGIGGVYAHAILQDP